MNVFFIFVGSRTVQEAYNFISSGNSGLWRDIWFYFRTLFCFGLYFIWTLLWPLFYYGIGNFIFVALFYSKHNKINKNMDIIIPLLVGFGGPKKDHCGDWHLNLTQGLDLTSEIDLVE